MNELKPASEKNAMSRLKDGFQPSFGLRNPHAQTILSSIGIRKAIIQRRFKPFTESQQAMLLSGGADIRLEGFLNRSASERSSSLAILIHGWEGSHDSTYIQSMALELLNQGIDVFRLNLRDHGDTHHLNEEIFNSTLIEEVIGAIEDLQAREHYSDYHLVGFSLGGNFSLRLAASAGKHDIALNSVIAFCPVIHAGQSNVVLNQSSNIVYSKYFARKWKRSLRKKLKHWPHYDYESRLKSMKTLEEMNQQLIPEYTSYTDLQSYFDAYAITGDRLTNTIAPCHLFFARDDMIIPVEGVQQLPHSDNLNVTVTDRGGHCGYIKNWKWECWQDEQALAIINRSRNDHS